MSEIHTIYIPSKINELSSCSSSIDLETQNYIVAKMKIAIALGLFGSLIVSITEGLFKIRFLYFLQLSSWHIGRKLKTIFLFIDYV